MMIEGKG